jgi:hypothetical protein
LRSQCLTRPPFKNAAYGKWAGTLLDRLIYDTIIAASGCCNRLPFSIGGFEWTEPHCLYYVGFCDICILRKTLPKYLHH